MKLNLAPAGPLRTCSTLEEFILNKNCSFIISDGADERGLIEPMFFSDEDQSFFWSFTKNYFSGLRPGAKTSSRTSIRRQDDCHILVGSGCDGVIIDSAGGLLNTTGVYFRKTAKGVVYDGDSVYIDPIIVQNTSRIDDTLIVFYDEHLTNYYHWWIENLLVLNLMTNVLGIRAAVLAPTTLAELGTWRSASLPIIERNVVYPATGQTHLIHAREVIWGSSYTLVEAPQYLYRGLAETVRRRVSTSSLPTTGVFIARNTSRQFTNNEDILNLMTKLGIRVCILDNMDQMEEIHLFRSCRIIIGVQGAGLANMLFANEGTCVLELMPSAEVRDHFWVLASKLGHRYGTVICRSAGETNDSSLTVDIDLLERAICGMLDVQSRHAPI